MANCLHELALLAFLEGDIQNAIALESRAQQQPQDVEFWTRSASSLTKYLLLSNQMSGAKEAAEQAIAVVSSRLSNAPALAMLRDTSLCILQQSAAKACVALALECRAAAKPGFEAHSEAACHHLDRAIANMENIQALPLLIRSLLDSASVQVSLAESIPAGLQAAYRKAAVIGLKAVQICGTLITQSVQPFVDVANGVPALSSAALLASAAHRAYAQYCYLLSVSVQQHPFVIRARPPIPAFPVLEGADSTPVLQYLDPLLNGQAGVADIDYDQVAIADKAVSSATSAVNLCGSGESRALVQSRAALGFYLAHRLTFLPSGSSCAIRVLSHLHFRCRLAGVAEAFWSGREVPEGFGPLLQQCRDELEWSLQQARTCGMYSVAADCAFELAVLCDPIDKKQQAIQACLSQSLNVSADVQTLMQSTLSSESRERVMQRLVEHVSDCGWPMDCKASVVARELLQKLSISEQRCITDAVDFEAVAAKQGSGCILLTLASRFIGSQVCLCEEFM